MPLTPPAYEPGCPLSERYALAQPLFSIHRGTLRDEFFGERPRGLLGHSDVDEWGHQILPATREHVEHFFRRL